MILKKLMLTITLLIYQLKYLGFMGVSVSQINFSGTPALKVSTRVVSEGSETLGVY